MFGKKKRFETIYEQGVTNVSKIIVDKETGVHYLVNTSGQAGGITPLLDRSGKVIVNLHAVKQED